MVSEKIHKMKIAILISAITLISNISFAQWAWQNPFPQGNELHDVCFADENTGFAVGA